MDRITPRHLGIIMDGNGRWAQKNGKKRQYGHRKGAMNVERIVEHAFLRGVSVVSLFAFPLKTGAARRKRWMRSSISSATTSTAT